MEGENTYFVYEFEDGSQPGSHCYFVRLLWMQLLWSRLESFTSL